MDEYHAYRRLRGMGQLIKAEEVRGWRTAKSWYESAYGSNGQKIPKYHIISGIETRYL